MERPTKSRSRKRKFSRLELLAELEDFFPNVPNHLVLDSNYLVPTEKSLDVFSEELYGWLEDVGLTGEDGQFIWSPQYECEDVSLFALALAKVKHLYTKLSKTTGRKPSSPALGLLLYDRETSRGLQGHCLLAVLRSCGWVRYEPQTQSYRPFTDSERQLAFATLF